VLARHDVKAAVFESLAIVDGVIYLRTDRQMIALGY
jgi:hypothetical protein